MAPLMKCNRRQKINALEQIIAGYGEWIPGWRFVCKRIECEDGTQLSVQASNFHYCSPRSIFGPYNSVEVGYPSAPVPNSWYQYMDHGEPDTVNENETTEQVYAYVPVELVREYCKAHGGGKGYAMPVFRHTKIDTTKCVRDLLIESFNDMVVTIE